MRKFILLLGLAALGAWLLTAPARAAEQADTEKLAKETQNPVANLISVPFQNDFNFGAGPDRDMIWIMNVQPVIPVPLNEDWNLITRTIVPIVNVPGLLPGEVGSFGMGDVNPSVFLSPATDQGFIWGVGVTTTLPTASLTPLGSGQWSMGPTAVGLYMNGPWVVGALANQQWSITGWSDTKVNQLLIQPFLNYNLPDGWYFTSSPIITGNFSASDGNQWTVPLGAGIGKLWRIGTVGLPLRTRRSCHSTTSSRRTSGRTGSCASSSSSCFRAEPAFRTAARRAGGGCLAWNGKRDDVPRATLLARGHAAPARPMEGALDVRGGPGRGKR